MALMAIYRLSKNIHVIDHHGFKIYMQCNQDIFKTTISNQPVLTTIYIQTSLFTCQPDYVHDAKELVIY